MTTFGCWRTSTKEQSSERQNQSLINAGCDVSRIYGDQITGTSSYGIRDQLPRCLDALREGDTLVLHELDRLGRTMIEMLVEMNALLDRGIAIKFLNFLYY